jgi:hypothetical protein
MKAVDRVKAAYAKAHKLTDEQTAIVRKEISDFIDQFLHGSPETPANKTGTLPDSN